MAKIEFEMSFEKFTFKYKGDQEKAEKLQGGINQFFGAIAETQNQVIDVEAIPIPDRQKLLSTNSETNESSPPKRKRRTKRATNGVVGVNGDKTNSNVQTGLPLAMRLIEEGFFSENRSLAEAIKELSRKGHNFKPNYLSNVLLDLTRKSLLVREKDSANKWVYRNGTERVNSTNQISTE